MNHQSLGSASTSGSQPDCTVWIKKEPEDDCAQTVENQSTDDVTPIDTDQIDVCKIEDPPKAKLESNDICYPLPEHSNEPVVKCENKAYGDCSPSINIDDDDHGHDDNDDDELSQVIEVPCEVDIIDDGSNDTQEVGVGYVIQRDAEEKDTATLVTGPDIEVEGTYVSGGVWGGGGRGGVGV